VRRVSSKDKGVTNIKAVGFDFFGTLVEAKAEANHCISSICQKLHQHEINLSHDEFTRTYRAVASDQREVRRSTQKEVSNSILLAETLKRLGYDVEASSPPIVEAVEAYFKPWKLAVYEDAGRAVERLRSAYRFGLISNFTDTLFLRSSLHRLGLEDYFEFVLVSEEVGWRKPHPLIFNRFLDLMGVEASETLFVGDDLRCDIFGAKNVGMKTAWIVRGLNREADEEVNAIQPDYIVHSLEELEELFMYSK
jgi:putative hydrolase of the HAD superfamily